MVKSKDFYEAILHLLIQFECRYLPDLCVMFVSTEWTVIFWAPFTLASNVIETEPLIVKFPGTMNGTRLTLYANGFKWEGRRTSLIFLE